MAKARSLSILSALLVFAAGSMGGHAARAEENCLPAPTGKTPPGSHWHYRTDPLKQTKCWYLRAGGDAAAQPAAATDGADAAAKPAAAPKPTPDAAAGEPHQRKPHQARAKAAPAGAQAPAQAGAQNPPPAGGQDPAQAASPIQAPPGNAPPPSRATQGGATPWPDPQPQQGGAGNVAWPDPPPAAMTASPESATTNTAAEPSAASQDTGSINANGASDASTAESTPPPPAQNNDVSGSTILALAIAMAFVGILMRWLVGRLFARRRKLAAERREPVWVTDEYVMPDALTRGPRRPPPGRVDPERLDDEVKHALQKLLRTLERSAA
jgi:hypothetical protein